MIREMQLNKPLSPTNKESLKKSLRSTPKSPKSPLDPIESESTFYKTMKEKNEKQMKDDKIIESLKNFVQSARKSSKNQSSSNVVFTSKDYLKSNNNQIFNSLFTRSKNNNRSSSSVSKLYSSFNKEEHCQNNGINLIKIVPYMEDLVKELKTSVFNKMTQEIAEKTQQYSDLEHNVDILNNRLQLFQQKLQGYKEYNTCTLNDTTKLEYYSERVNRENTHMDMEISMTKKRIEDMKTETFEKDRETRQIKYEILNLEADISYLQQETRRMNREVIEMQNEKKNLKAALIFVKKRSDELKEKVIKKDFVNKEFISDVNTLLKRGKTIY